MVAARTLSSSSKPRAFPTLKPSEVKSLTVKGWQVTGLAFVLYREQSPIRGGGLADAMGFQGRVKMIDQRAAAGLRSIISSDQPPCRSNKHGPASKSELYRLSAFNANIMQLPLSTDLQLSARSSERRTVSDLKSLLEYIKGLKEKLAQLIKTKKESKTNENIGTGMLGEDSGILKVETTKLIVMQDRQRHGQYMGRGSHGGKNNALSSMTDINEPPTWQSSAQLARINARNKIDMKSPKRDQGV
ncbi:hypothetical protein FQN53_006856 [Emmonsiellopsis sp. PD_33]|nr:hypothetical protein FQN53_006856 [Emmonsiellopsis sp. PD_33]